MCSSDSTPYEKVGKNEPVSIADEVPFEIPKSWEWARLRNICNVVSARRVHQADWRTEGVPFYRAREIGKLSEVGYVDNELFISEELYSEFSKSGVPHPGDLMVTAVGTLGKTYIVQPGDRFYYKDASVLCFENFGGILPEYLKIVMATPLLRNQIKNRSAGTTVGTITIVNANAYIIPVPPLQEQQRIIDKLNEIEPLMLNYESVEDSLDSLNGNFPDQLKKSILQIAVQGKLVPQDPSDEPASVLLDRIRAEKERLIAAGKIKRDKNESVIFRRDNSHYEKYGFDEKYIEEDLPFEIPETWAWARLISIIERKPQNGKSSKSVEYITSTKVLTLTATTSGTFKPDAYKYVPISVSQDSPLWLRKNDILIQRSNSREYVGTSCIYTGDDNEYIYPDLMMKIQLLPGVSAEYLDIVLKSPMVRNYYTTAASGTSESMPKINQSIVCQTLIPIPPANEQKIIVETVTNILEVVKVLDV